MATKSKKAAFEDDKRFLSAALFDMQLHGVHPLVAENVREKVALILQRFAPDAAKLWQAVCQE